MAYLTPYYPPPPDLNQTQTGSPPSQYFPPPQPPSSASIQNMYGSPGSTSKVPGYQQQTLQPENDADIYELAHNIYHPDDYSTLATMVPQATTVVFRPPPTALAPAGGHVLSDLPPAPHDGIMSQPDVSSPYSPGLLMPAGTPEDELPTDLARGQGRRGTLPNAAGRRAAPKSGTGARNTTYLGAKHLKRHFFDIPMNARTGDIFALLPSLEAITGNATSKCAVIATESHLSYEDGVNHLDDESDLSADNMAHPSGMILGPDSMNK
ncbi:hypothetical protein H9L39_17485 [Fusarium oxysporum f. sp. albedinis]|nr:hypothetical protein H9L39_17485 [Fusarium oxysporum f. sp. albedinis]